MKAFLDSNIGVSTGKLHWMKSKTGSEMFWCRTAVAFMGSFNNPVEYIMNTSPFDPSFRDNYVEGKGKTKEEALEALKEDLNKMSNCLWAE